MVWKILSALSAACLAGAAAFAWFYQQSMKNEKARLESANSNLAMTQTRKSDAEVALKEKQDLLATAEKDRGTAKAEVVKLAAEVQEKEASLAVLKSNLEQVTNQVKSVQQQIKDAGDIESLVAQIEKLKKQQVEAEGAVANQNQRVAAAQEQTAFIASQITKLREAEAQDRRGVVAPDFTARVAEYFPEWDFAILSKGNSQGVFANADLEVKRGREVIAKLKVRNVEQNGAIADLVPGSLADGASIRQGDVVVAAAKQSAEEEKKSATAASTPATGTTPETPDATPMPTTAPANSDPFGTPGGMAPSAPAPANSDPFGGAPAPTPAPTTPAPSSSDPFGSAPAPAPAPAGGAPMNADPFAPAN